MVGNLKRILPSIVFAMALTVVASPQVSEPEPAQYSEWNIYTVDSEGQVGSHNSLALDGDDNPHISYYDSANRRLKYAKWTGIGWSNETVDFYGQATGAGSIALDSHGYPHMSYTGLYYVGGSLRSSLRYAKWNGSAWKTETVDPGRWNSGYTSIALDKNDYPHISYKDGYWPGGLKYARWNGTAWILEDIELSRVYWVGAYSSLALDKNDYPHISYYDGNEDGGLEYAKWNGSAWNIEIVDPTWSWRHTSLALDSNDYPHIAYYANETNELKYAKWNGTAWSNETLDSIPIVYWQHLQPSIALDNNDNPRISYSGSYNNDLRYAEWNGTAWNTEIVHLAGDVAVSNSLALDSDYQPHISYYNGTDQDLKYATKGELGEAKRSISLDIDPDTLNLRSNGKWITAYLTTENAYADDIDASSLLLNDVITPAWWDVQNDTTLMVKFDRAAVGSILLASDLVDIKINGQWKDGESFEVHDVIRVINPGQ